MCGRYWRSHGAPSGSPFLSLSGDFWVLDWLSRRWCRWDFLDLEGKEGRQRLFLELPCAWTTATRPFLFHLLFHALWDRVPCNLDWPGTSRIFLSSWSSSWNCRCHHCALFGASLFPVEGGCWNRKTIGLSHKEPSSDSNYSFYQGKKWNNNNNAYWVIAMNWIRSAYTSFKGLYIEIC